MAGNNQPRSFKFYRENEREVMEKLGLKPTKNSGSGWIEKEDGQNDYIICQLKSTDKQSISINQKDIRILEQNAGVSHKLPVFAIQFLNTGEVWLMAKPEDFTMVSQYLKNGEVDIPDRYFGEIDLSECEETTVQPRRVIKSSGSAREQFHEERESKYRKENKAWK